MKEIFFNIYRVGKLLALSHSFLFLTISARSAGYNEIAKDTSNIEGVIVEKYYESVSIDFNDSTAKLPENTKVYRIYIDLKPGCKLQTVYGSEKHELLLKTSTKFFNDQECFAETGFNIDARKLHTGTVPFDTWITLGAASRVHIDLSKALFNNGQMSIPVSLVCAETVNSFDIDMLINDLKSTVASVESPYSIDFNWNYISDDKMLSIASFSLQAIPTENTISIILNLLTPEPITSSDLEGALSLINGTAATLTIIDANVGVDDPKQNLVNVYPNPASDKIFVEVSADSKVVLLDLNGKQILTTVDVKAFETTTMDVSNLSAGVYMVKIYNDKTITNKKVIVRK